MINGHPVLDLSTLSSGFQSDICSLPFSSSSTAKAQQYPLCFTMYWPAGGTMMVTGQR
jgi:hypothetical protein